MTDFSELFRTTEEQITPVEAKIEGKFPFYAKKQKLKLTFAYVLIGYIIYRRGAGMAERTSS